MTIENMPPLSIDVNETWTSAEDGQTFERWIGDNTPFTRHVKGVTPLGFDLAYFTIGSGPADRTLMIVGGIHGDEYGAREAVLKLVQGWAIRLDEGDAALSGWLARNRVVIMPTASPDGRERGSYGNSLGVDPSMDGLSLVSQERRVIEQAITDHDPLVIIDCHEYNSNGFNLWTGENRGADVHPDIAAGSANLREAVRTAVEDVGYAVSKYPQTRKGALLHTATYRHAIALLLETRTGTVSSGQYDPRLVRVDVHLTSLAAIVEYFDTNHAALNAARQASKTRALTAGAPDWVALGEHPQIVPADVYPIYVDGYELAEPFPAWLADIYGIESDWLFVPIDQAARGFIPELLDPDAPGRRVIAERSVASPLLQGAPSQVFVQVAGQKREVIQVIHMVDGVRREVTFA